MRVLGLISGTSMDGIDAATAELRFDGDTVVLRPLHHTTVPYSWRLQADLRGALPPAAASAEALCRLDTQIGQEFAAAATQAIEAAGGADLVVSHGQTVFHWVQDSTVMGTLQIGQPAWIAERTGLPVVSDLRPADVAAGGQGAPLVSLFDVLLLGGAPHPRAALNLGGIANLTIVPPAGSERPPVAFDCGPANALLDAAVRHFTGGAEDYDAGGARAMQGTLDEGLLSALRADSYYGLAPPKTTGKEKFNAEYLELALTMGAHFRHVAATGGAEATPPSLDDVLATLAAHAAEVVATDCVAYEVAEVIASGGGTENAALMAALAAELGSAVHLGRIDDLGLASDAKEAYAFALLGFLTVHGLPGNVPSCTGARHPAILGRINPGRQPLALATNAKLPSRLAIQGTG